MNILVTGGTGSFGQAFIRHLLHQGTPAAYRPGVPTSGLSRDYVKRIVVFSRDELKQHDMRSAGFTDERLRYFIGDVRDASRLRRAMAGVDTVVHAAALKQVPACEYNPLEALDTNVGGARNVIDAALDVGVERVLALGTDKACDPATLYGATKLMAEKLMVDANNYSGGGGVKFAGTRYGNVIGSRGSVLPLWMEQHKAGIPLTVTDLGMTRFVMTLGQGVRFVSDSLQRMRGGEVFVPKLPAVDLLTLAQAVTYPELPKMTRVGLRAGEKMHELMVSQHESPRTTDKGDHFEISPLLGFVARPFHDGRGNVPAGFTFGSDTTERLTVEGFRELAGL